MRCARFSSYPRKFPWQQALWLKLFSLAVALKFQFLLLISQHESFCHNLVGMICLMSHLLPDTNLSGGQSTPQSCRTSFCKTILGISPVLHSTVPAWALQQIVLMCCGIEMKSFNKKYLMSSTFVCLTQPVLGKQKFRAVSFALIYFIYR